MRLRGVTLDDVQDILSEEGFTVTRVRTTTDGNGTRLELEGGAVVTVYHSGVAVFQGRYPQAAYRAVKQARPLRRSSYGRTHRGGPQGVRLRISTEKQLFRWLVEQVSGIKLEHGVKLPGTLGEIIHRLMSRGELVVSRDRRPALVKNAIADSHCGLCRSKPQLAQFTAEAVSTVVASGELSHGEALTILIRLVDPDQILIVERMKAGELRWVSTPAFTQRHGFTINTLAG